MRRSGRGFAPTRLSMILLVTVGQAVSTSQAQWTCTVIHPSGHPKSLAQGVGGTEVVGYGNLQSVIGTRAFLWNGAALPVDLTPSGATESAAQGVAGGWQVGSAGFGGATRAGMWNGSAGSWVDLHPPGAGFSNSIAYGISGGQQVGMTFPLGQNQGEASLWADSAGSWVNLGGGVAYATDGAHQVGVSGLHAVMWSGTAASVVDLHPAGASLSFGRGIHAGQQVGGVDLPAGSHASLWTGSAASWIDLHPPTAVSVSAALGVFDGQQVGYAVVEMPAGVFRNHAGVWRGTAASWVDLHLLVPPEFNSSYANGVWSDASTTRIVGYGFNTQTGFDQALQWTGPGVAGLGACCLPDGVCIVSSAAECAAIGVFQGAGFSCAAVNCPQPPTGACCIAGSCSVLTQAQCAAQSGVYQGNNTVCASVVCPPPVFWVEQGDAPDLPATAQRIEGPAGSTLTEIRGSVGAGDADLYAIEVCNAAAFSATTVGGASFDTRLYLFDSTGHGVSFSEDASGILSTITSQFVPGPGIYYIAISCYPNSALGSATQGKIWNDAPFGVERAPDGPAATESLGAWSGGGSAGGYTVFLQGACYVPAPSLCYANCDGSTAAPVLNVADFTCFLQGYAMGAAYANCDGSTAAPVLNVADFTCFLQTYAVGCP